MKSVVQYVKADNVKVGFRFFVEVPINDNTDSVFGLSEDCVSSYDEQTGEIEAEKTVYIPYLRY